MTLAEAADYCRTAILARCRRAGASEDSEDIANDVWVALAEHWPAVADPVAYAQAACRRMLARRWQRGRGHQSIDDVMLVSREPSPEAIAARKESLRLLAGEIETLRSTYRDVIRRGLAGQAQAEVEAAAGIDATAYRLVRHRAKRILMRRMAARLARRGLPIARALADGRARRASPRRSAAAP